MDGYQLASLLADTGQSNFVSDDEMPKDYCPVHGWDGGQTLYHETSCMAYAEKLERLRQD